MKRLLLVAALLVTAFSMCRGAQIRWNNAAGGDYNTNANWLTNTVPGSTDAALFTAGANGATVNLSSSASLGGLDFSNIDGTTVTGYNITSSSSAITLTLLGTSTGTSPAETGVATATNALRAENLVGTNTISAPLVLGAAAGASQAFYQLHGGTLVVSGPISSTNTIAGLQLISAGPPGTATFTLSGANTYAGNTTFAGPTEQLNINSATAISSGALVVSVSGRIDNTSGSAITLTNNNAINLSGASLTFVGSNTLSFGSGIVTMGGANRTITTTGGTLQVGGIQQDATPRLLTKAGAGTLIINGASTFSGGLDITAGTVVANADGALGAGNVSLTAGNITLTLQNGATQDYIADTANLSLAATTDIINLNYSGTDAIGAFTIAGIQQSPGTYGATGSGAMFQLPEFSGTGMLLVTVPEPSTLTLIGLSVLFIGGAKAMRRRSA